MEVFTPPFSKTFPLAITRVFPPPPPSLSQASSTNLALPSTSSKDLSNLVLQIEKMLGKCFFNIHLAVVFTALMNALAWSTGTVGKIPCPKLTM
ncbi:MAG: hypothetical protein CM15mP23_05980 [Cryomorphaceae bacterium]|nr:MAG: hypothetical protein CM15mP23_05980 [Cryomorphaceae bacterium]